MCVGSLPRSRRYFVRMATVHGERLSGREEVAERIRRTIRPSRRRRAARRGDRLRVTRSRRLGAASARRRRRRRSELDTDWHVDRARCGHRPVCATTSLPSYRAAAPEPRAASSPLGTMRALSASAGAVLGRRIHASRVRRSSEVRTTGSRIGEVTGRGMIGRDHARVGVYEFTTMVTPRDHARHGRRRTSAHIDRS